MYPGSLPYALSLLVIAILTGGIGIYAFHHPKQPGAIIFGWMMFSMAAWNILYAVEIASPTFSGKLLAGKLEYIGIASLPLLWFAFALEYTGHANWLTRNRRFILIGFPIETNTIAAITHRMIFIA